MITITSHARADIGFMITEKQRDNLLKLAKGLEEMPPPDVEFDMSTYQRSFSHGIEKGLCGSAGCAIGCASYIIEPRQAVYPHHGIHKFEYWEDYALRLFGFSNHTGSIGDWCFGEKWRSIDNTPKGAAARIRWVLEHGVPENWYAQMLGIDPLCYTAGVAA